MTLTKVVPLLLALAALVGCSEARQPVSSANTTAGDCANCHGVGLAGVPAGDPDSAPPVDAHGRADSPAVGAHQPHLRDGPLRVAVPCGECHVVPTSLLQPGHIDKDRADVIFGPLARTGTTAADAPAYDPGTLTCSSTYCHGNIKAGSLQVGLLASPKWTDEEDAVACGTCHAIPPPIPPHDVVQITPGSCSSSNNPIAVCHPASYTPTSVDRRLHIDGRVCPPACTPATP